MRPLQEGLHEDILVHRCDHCPALWMSAKNLDRLDDNVSVDASRIEWESTRQLLGAACPWCIGRYRTQNPLLEEVEIQGRSDIKSMRCASCSGFLIQPDALDRLREHIVGRPYVSLPSD